MGQEIKWGILSTANIGIGKVIPAMRKSAFSDVIAIASSDIYKAEQAAVTLGISKFYGSYEALLADPEIDAVYIPLPNHLHVPFTIKALAAGKHVLCEKPVGLNGKEADELYQVSKQYPQLKVMEAFMYRFHPQWQRAKEIADEGQLGDIKHIHTFFSYYNADADNIRNKPETGGGALMDIGCYCISFPRFILGKEPQKTTGLVYRDPAFQTDTLTSGLLDFGGGVSAAFTCSTQLERYQRVSIIGTKGRLEIEIPCNAPIDQPCRLWLQRDNNITEIMTKIADQYTLQVDAFSKAILDNTPVPFPLTDAINNMKVIDALFESAAANTWVKL
jgi:predicted dehydrogenase